MPLKLAGLTFDVAPDLVFTDDQPLPVIRGNLVVDAKLAPGDLKRLKKAIDEDERAILETTSGRGEVEIRTFVLGPDEGVVRHFEGLDVRAWAFHP